MPKEDNQHSRTFLFPAGIVGIITMALLLYSANLSAQRSGGRGGGRGGARGAGANTSGPAADTPEIKDFNRLMAVQATESQTQQFQAVAKSTEAARKQAHDLMEQAESANASIDLTSQTAALKDAVDGARSWNDYFVKTFSNAQVSGLKEFTKKLSKAEFDVMRERGALDQDSRGAVDSKRISTTAERLEKVLTKFQAEQLSMADEMGIPKSSP
jgi:hypothetical protein